MTLYFISGLGADERMFQKLQLPQLWHIQHLAWLTPSSKEPLVSYCRRMAASINTNEEFIVVGLSFGGIIAVELTKIIRPKQTLILSSISTRHELPVAYALLGKLKINTLIPSFFLNRIYPFTYWYFGVTIKADKRLLRQIIKDTPPRFLKWAINEIVNWKNEQQPDDLIHVHGTKDRILPIRNIKADIKVKGGGHLMVHTQAEDVSRILTSIICYES